MTSNDTTAERRAQRISKECRASAAAYMKATGCDYPARLMHELGGLTAQINKLCAELQPTRPDTNCCTVSTDMGDIEVFFDYSPPTPDVMYLPNGDPGYPGDPEELDIFELHIGNAVLDMEWLSVHMQDLITEGVMRHLEDEAEDAQAERADRELEY